MVIATLIKKSSIKGRIKKGLPTYGFVWSWEGLYYVDFLKKDLYEAFMKRFGSLDDEDINYASGIKEIEKGRKIDFEKGKYLIVEVKLVKFDTVEQLYEAFCETEEEYISKTYGYAQEFDEENDEENKE